MKFAPSLALAGLTVACSVPNIVGFDEAGADGSYGDAALDGAANDAEGGTYCNVSGIPRPDKCCPMSGVPCYGTCTNPGCTACGQCPAGTVCCSPMGSTGNCFSTCQ
jgi:hypothetical protein